MMPALSFQHEWLDALLRDDKQQTTRPQTDRFKVGDICHIYIEQRRRITEKPLRQLTEVGYYVMEGLMFTRSNYPAVSYKPRPYHAHFLGKVEITEAIEMCPCDNSSRSAWARADGFDNFGCADAWFTKRYGHDWYQQTWTVIRWNGWQERYFEAGEV